MAKMLCWLRGVLVDFLADGGEEGGESGLFFGGEAAEDEFDVAEGVAEVGIVGAEAEAGEVGGVEVAGDGFEAIVAAAGAVEAVADFPEGEVEIVADDEEVARGEFIEVEEGADSLAGFVVESLGFDEKAVAVFEPEGIEFWFLPIKMIDFRVKVKSKKTEIVASKVVFVAGVAEADDEFHGVIIA